jgi:hypothetical protein
MIQELAVGFIVIAAVLYSVWRFLPARKGRPPVRSACGACSECKGCGGSRGFL